MFVVQIMTLLQEFRGAGLWRGSWERERGMGLSPEGQGNPAFSFSEESIPCVSGCVWVDGVDKQTIKTGSYKEMQMLEESLVSH